MQPHLRFKAKQSKSHNSLQHPNSKPIKIKKHETKDTVKKTKILLITNPSINHNVLTVTSLHAEKHHKLKKSAQFLQDKLHKTS